MVADNAKNLTAQEDLIDFAALDREQLPQWIEDLEEARRLLLRFETSGQRRGRQEHLRGEAHPGAPLQHGTRQPRTRSAPVAKENRLMTDEKTGGTCGCCGQPAAACEKPVQFGKAFRVNATKGIAFHGTMKAEALIVRSTVDRTFRLATGTLRRTALSAALDR